MNYRITSITNRYLFWLFMISIPLFILNIYVSSLLHLSKMIFGINLIIILILGIFLALQLSKKKIVLTLMDNQVLIENIRIDMINVDGFYINRESPILTIIEIMDKNSNIYGLTSLNFGRIGRDFEVFLSDFERIVRDVNPNLKELTFFDFHTKQYIFTKIVLIIGSVLLLSVDLVFFYLVIYEHYPMTWKILWVNSIFVVLYGFYKRNKKTTFNTL